MYEKTATLYGVWFGTNSVSVKIRRPDCKATKCPLRHFKLHPISSIPCAYLFH